MIDKHDPHWCVGAEHGYEDAPRYHWHDRVHQARYDAGYAWGNEKRWRERERSAYMQDLARSLQGSRRQ